MKSFFFVSRHNLLDFLTNPAREYEENFAIENLFSSFKHALHTCRSAYFVCIYAYVCTYVRKA